MAQNNSTQLAATKLSTADVSELEQVFWGLQEQRNALMRLSGLMGEAVGTAVEFGNKSLTRLPKVQQKLDKIARYALQRAFRLAITGLNAPKLSTDRTALAKASVAISGVLGGFTGLVGLLPDITFTTLAMMREIARIAQEEGEDLSDPQTRAACLEIFAFRAFPGSDEQDIDLGFFSARTLLRGQSMMVMMGDVASHYGFALGQKLSLRMMPVAGALFGASLNTAFFNHYRAVARARFTVRRLEREHGPMVREIVQGIYKQTRHMR